MIIDAASGNIGVGTSSPKTNFQVSGGFLTDSYTFLRSDGQVGSLFHAQLSSPNQHMHFLPDYAGQTGAMDTTIFFGYNSDIMNYHFFSKYGGVNGSILQISATPSRFVKVYGDFVATGTKSAIVETKDYGQRLLYAVEAPDNRFTDEGIASITNGSARINLDPIYLETIEGRLAIQLTPYINSELYVAEIGKDYFIVKVHDGEQNGEFSWHVSAFRKGYSTVRLAKP